MAGEGAATSRGHRLARALMLGLLALVVACRPAADRAAAQVALADQYAQAGDAGHAMAALGSATALDPDNVDAWVKLGQAQLQTGDATSADQSFQRAQELAPDNIDALQNLVLLSVRGGELDRAKRYLDPLLVLRPNDPAGLLAQGTVALRERRPAEALSAGERISADYPDVPEGFMLRARALTALGRGAEARRGLEQWVSQHAALPRRQDVLLLLLDDYRAAGDVGGIRATALRLHALDPGDPRYAIESARALRAGGRGEAANAGIAALLAAHPASSAVARAVLGYWRDTLPPEAASAKAVALAAAAPRPVRIALADGLVDMGAGADALALVAPLVSAKVDARNADATTVQVRALAALGRTGAARQRVDQLLAFDGANLAGLLVRARLFLAARDFDAAIADAQLAQSVDGNSEDATILLARIYATQGNAPLAQQAYALGVQSFPDSFPLLSSYVDWLLAAGRRPEAMRVTGSFARLHRRYAPAWRKYEALCRAADDPCQFEAQAVVGDVG